MDRKLSAAGGPNLKVSGVGCQVSGKKNKKAKTWLLDSASFFLVSSA